MAGQSRIGAKDGESAANLATIGMICGLVGLLVFGIILGPIAIVMSLMALSRMNQSGNDAGRGMAITGLVVGGVDGIAFFVILGLLVR